MPRGVDKANAVVRVFEELLAARHRLDNAYLPFDPEVNFGTAPSSDEAHQRFRLVGVELIMMTKSERSAAPTPRSSIMKPLYVSAFGLLKMTHSAAIASLWIILMSAEGLSNTEQGRRLEVDRQRVRRWRVRWAANEERLAAAVHRRAAHPDHRGGL